MNRLGNEMISKLLIAKLFPSHLCYKKFPSFSYYFSSSFYSTSNSSTTTELNADTIRLLEKLSLVNFGNQENIAIVESAIKFADGINAIDTDNVEPLVTVLENRSLKLREDAVTEGKCKKEILQNAALVEEDYFVAPPGNIPANLQKLKE